MLNELRSIQITILFLISLAHFQVVLAQQQITEEKAVAERTLLLINNYRQSKGLKALVPLPVIYEECLKHCYDMAEIGNISHDGFDKRMRNIGKSVRFGGSGENVAYNSNQHDPALSAFKQWVGSRGHHQNMLGKYTHTGLAVVKSKDEYYFTQIFIKMF
ncbi:MAG: CAP domain-containing protein [Thermoflexibacter sp.]